MPEYKLTLRRSPPSTGRKIIVYITANNAVLALEYAVVNAPAVGLDPTSCIIEIEEIKST